MPGTNTMASSFSKLHGHRPPQPAALRLRILSDPANLAPVRKAIEDLALQAGFDATACGEIALCVNEAMANVTRHAYAGATDRPVEISAETGGDAIVIRIRDWGSGVDPTTCRRPPHDPLRPGGLGLICMARMMDDLQFHSQPDGMLLEMTRKINR